MESQRAQFSNMNTLGNVPNVSSMLHQSFPNGTPNPGLTDNGVGNGMGFNQMLPETQDSQNLDPRNFQHNQQQHHFGSNGNQQQHHQQQQILQLSRQSPQAAAILQQQRFMQLQQQQHQQNILKATPPQRSPVQPQFPSQNLPMRSSSKPIYEPGTCARRLQQYMYQLRQRPEDNRIEFWRKFVAEFFAPNAKKKWCVSTYGSGRQTTGVFPRSVWDCEICNSKPGRGFEATVDILPRLFKIKYESGTLEELLHVDMPREYQNSSGQIVLDYAKAVQQSSFENLLVVRKGQLRLVFSSDLKICSWEFCAQSHEEFIPRKLLVPQINQLGVAVQKYKDTTQNPSSNTFVSDLQNVCNMFGIAACQLSKDVEVPLVNDLGYAKRYVRSLQISEVVNSMKNLMEYSRENIIGPIECLAKFPRRSNSSPGFCSQQREDQLHQPQLASQQQAAGQISNNGVAHVNDSLNAEPPGSSSSTFARVMHQNSFNSRQQTLGNGSCSSNGVHMPSPGSSIPQSQANVSPFHFPSPSTTNHPLHSLHGGMSTDASPNISIQQPALSGDVDGNDTQSSVQKIINDCRLASNLGGFGGKIGTGSLGNDVRIQNGTVQTNNNMSLNQNGGLIDDGAANINVGICGTGFGNMGNGLGQSTIGNGLGQSTMGNGLGQSTMGNGLGQSTMGFGQSTMGNRLDQSNMGNGLGQSTIGNGLGQSTMGNGLGQSTMGNGLGQSTMSNGFQTGLPNNSLGMDGRMNQNMNQRNQLLSGRGSISGFNNLQFNH